MDDSSLTKEGTGIERGERRVERALQAHVAGLMQKWPLGASFGCCAQYIGEECYEGYPTLSSSQHLRFCRYSLTRRGWFHPQLLFGTADVRIVPERMSLRARS